MHADKNIQLITVGRFGAAYGVKGWLRIHSFTEPVDNILAYQPWLVKLQGGWQSITLVDSRKLNKGIIATIASCNNKETTALYRNAEIAIQRNQLPALADDEFYWTDLQNLSVHTVTGERLGVVDYILPTGANDVLVVKGKREHLIPYLPDTVIKKIDLANGEIIVDWDPNF